MTKYIIPLFLISFCVFALIIWAIVSNNIVCDDFLNPQTETLKSWNITADEKYVKAIEKIKKREGKE